MQTGGVTDRIPIINRATDASRQAGAASNQQTQQLLSQYGLANSAFGARIMAEGNQSANEQTADTGTNYVESMLNNAPATASAATSGGAGLLGAAESGDITNTGTSKSNTEGLQHQDSGSFDFGSLAAA